VEHDLAARNMGRTRRRKERTLLLNTRKVLAPKAFVIRLGPTEALGDLDETVLLRGSAGAPTGDEVFEHAAVPLEEQELGRRERCSGA